MASNCESLDTSVILRIILNDIPELKDKAVQHLLCNNVSYYIDDYVLGETEHILGSKGYTRTEIVEVITNLLNNPVFIYNHTLFEDVFQQYLTHPALSFNDCYIATKAATRPATPLWTFDHKLALQSPAAQEIQ